MARSSSRLAPMAPNQGQHELQMAEFSCKVDGSWAGGWRGGTGFALFRGQELVAYKANTVRACCPEQAEALALLDAVSYAAEQGIDHCNFLTDNQTLASLATQAAPPTDADWRAYWETLEIWKMFKTRTTFICQHISRNHNELADSLAKKARLQGLSYIGYTFPTFTFDPGSYV